MTHHPLCSTSGCPHPTDDSWHRCFVCGKAEGDHQHFPKKSLAGKGAKIVAFLCRNHHQKITLHQWREGVFTHPDGSVRYYVQDTKGKQQCERIIKEGKDADRETPKELHSEVVESGEATQGGADEEVSEDARDHGGALHGVVWQPTDQDVRQGESDVDGAGVGGIGLGEPSAPPEINAIAPSQIGATNEKALVGVGPPIALNNLTDEQLATMFQEGDKRQAEGFLLKCRVVQAYRERHIQAWRESWLDNAYELFHDSRRMLFAYANIAVLVDKADTYLVENIAPLTSSTSLMKHIGKKSLEDGKVALEAAVTHLAEFGEPPSVAGLEHRLGVEAKPPDVCPLKANDYKHRFRCACGKEK